MPVDITLLTAKDCAAGIRKAIKAAQTSGTLDPQRKVSVCSDTFSMGSTVTIRVTNVTTDEILLPNHEDLDHRHAWTDLARDLSDALHAIVEPWAAWDNEKTRFLDIQLGGMSAPDPR